MKEKSINPNLVSAVLIGFTVLFLTILPIRIEFGLPAVEAQETPAPTTETVGYGEAAALTVVEYTLRTVLGQTPPMAFQGVGGSIDGQINPLLIANVGDTVRITLINGDPIIHNLNITEFNVATGDLIADEETVTVEFIATMPGDFVYFCSIV